MLPPPLLPSFLFSLAIPSKLLETWYTEKDIDFNSQTRKQKNVSAMSQTQELITSKVYITYVFAFIVSLLH